MLLQASDGYRHTSMKVFVLVTAAEGLRRTQRNHVLAIWEGRKVRQIDKEGGTGCWCEV